jgi:hypothetical protein
MAVSRTVSSTAATGSVRPRTSAANGSAQTMYQGRTHAVVASTTSAAAAAPSIQPRPPRARAMKKTIAAAATTVSTWRARWSGTPMFA